MKLTSKWFMAAAAVVATAGTAMAGPIGLVDNFGGTLGAYTSTRILKATPAASDNVYAWSNTAGSLQIDTTSYFAIEQYALTRTDVTLGVGETLIADYANTNTNSQDIGLYVGAGTPTSGVRADYVNVYARNNGQVFTRGFNGTTELGLAGGATPSPTGLFVTRTGSNTFDLGYIVAGVRTTITSRTMTNGSIGNAVGV